MRERVEKRAVLGWNKSKRTDGIRMVFDEIISGLNYSL